MSRLEFSLENYQEGLGRRLYSPPEGICPYYEVDPVRYRSCGDTDLRRNNLGQAIEEIRKRTSREYFTKTYPLQAKTLDYSTRTFPAYRFILPEVMTEDWLAIVDWGKFQRDHVLHQPLCGYIILKLLDGDGVNDPLELLDGQSILERCVKQILKWEETAYIKDFLINCGMSEDDPILERESSIAHNVWRAFFREVAYIAAVYHDLGYPWQYAERIQGNLEGLNTTAIRQNQSSEQIVELFGHRLLFHALNGYQKLDAACPSTWRDRLIKLTDVALSKTHGLPGALGFLHLNDCVRRYPNSTQSPLHLLCVEWAAVAIMMHDMKKIYWGNGISESKIPENPFLRLGFDRDPLSSIVTLVDIIQEFERPTVTYGANGDIVTLEYKEACYETDFEIDRNGVLTICYRMKTDEMRAVKRKMLAEDEHEYFDTQYGYLDLSSLGINRVKLEAR